MNNNNNDLVDECQQFDFNGGDANLDIFKDIHVQESGWNSFVYSFHWQEKFSVRDINSI